MAATLDLSTVDPQKLALAKQLLARVPVPADVLAQQRMVGMPIDQFAKQHFYTEDGSKIQLFPHQIAKFNYFFDPNNCPPFGFQTILNSTIKKCQAYGQEIQLRDGKIEKVEHLIGQGFGVRALALDGSRQVVPAQAMAEDNGLESCLTIRTKYGRCLIVTKEHPLLAHHYGWTEARHLHVGAEIAHWDDDYNVLRWDEIFSIQENEPVPTVAISVPGYENYLAADSTVQHNSGKTAEAGIVCRWVCETWGGSQSVISVANDKEQNRGRIYGAVVASIQQDPYYDKRRKVLSSYEGLDRWRVIERDLLHIPTGSIIKAIAGDHEGEAGSNPTLTAFTEIWALRLERDKRLWAELTPVPTRPRSIRYVETYAGYKGESNILWELWQQATKDGKHLVASDMPAWPFPPDDDEGHIPFYVNYDARLCAYIDQGVKARRMPWQQGERGDAYYAAQAYEFRNEPWQYERLHNNNWVERANAFIPIQMWLNCYDAELLKPENSLDAIAQKRTPCVVGADAAVSSDCTAVVLMHRHPTRHQETCVRIAQKWDPPPGGQMDYRSTIEPFIKSLCAKFNVIEVAYDPTQLHHLMSDLRRTDRRRSDPDFFPSINTVEFGQGIKRNRADKRLFDMIRDQQVHHDGFLQGNHSDMIEHLQNSGAEQSLKEDTKLRIVKLDVGKIDLTVAMSMANHECMELML